MCFEWLISSRKKLHRDFHKLFECSCDLCGKNFDKLENLVIHTGVHSTEDINTRLLSGYGTVRCNKCWKSFTSVAALYDHPCVQPTSVIEGLSPIPSSDSLESVVIYQD